MKKSDGDRARLLHILEAIQYIHSFASGKTKTDIYDDPMFRFAIERQLEIIGEAANHLSDELKITRPEIEWRKIVAFRNFVAHEYFGIDLELVWDIVVSKIPRWKAPFPNCSQMSNFLMQRKATARCSI